MKRDNVQGAKSGEDFNFGTTEEVGTSRSVGEAEGVWTDGRRSAKWRLARCRGSGRKREPKPEPTEQGGRRAMKKKTMTWTEVAKG